MVFLYPQDMVSGVFFGLGFLLLMFGLFTFWEAAEALYNNGPQAIVGRYDEGGMLLYTHPASHERNWGIGYCISSLIAFGAMLYFNVEEKRSV